jgi:PAS domain S-box-containing protein
MTDAPASIAATAPETVPTAALTGLPLALVLTNPRIEGNPIVYANAAFTDLTGHPAMSVIGKPVEALLWPETGTADVDRILEAVRAGEDLSLRIDSHRADGTAFPNRLSLTPLGSDGETDYVLWTMSAPSDAEERFEDVLDQLREIQHRVKNHLAMIVSLIRLQARSPEPDMDYTVLSRRIEALQLLYQELSDSGVSSTASLEVPLGAYVSRIAAAVGHLDGRPGVRVNVMAEEVQVDAGTAGRVGLLVSEILTNALRHAFSDRETGLVETRLQLLSEGVVRIQIADDGVGLPEDHAWPSGGNLGSRIVQSLLQGLDARHSVDSSTSGTTITIDIPDARAARSAT